MRFDRSILFSGFLVAGLLAACTSLSGQVETDTYNKGVEKYSLGEFHEAAEIWTSLVASGYSSADLLYNTGNAYFKCNDIPSAILYYEKALMLKPFDEDIRYNLEIARTHVVDDFESIPELFLVRWFRMVSLVKSSDYWAISSIILFSLFLAMVLLWLLSARRPIKKAGFSMAIVFLFISLFTVSLSLQSRPLKTKKGGAIVFSSAVTGKSSPGDEGKELFVIHEGTRVRIEEQVGEWYEIRLSDGNLGWIHSSDVRKI